MNKKYTNIISKSISGEITNRTTSLFPMIRLSLFILAANIVSLISFGQTVVTNPANPWVVPVGVTTVTVECWGGGGGGGGAATNSNGSAGGGGGGGAYSMQVISVSPSQTYTVTIGSGGTGGSSTSAGAKGGTTTFTGTGGTCSAEGGYGGGGINGGGGTGGSNGSTGTGFLYAGGYGAYGYVDGSFDIGGGGGGGAGNAGVGGNATTGNSSHNGSAGGAGGIGSPNSAPYKGGAGGSGNNGINGNSGANGSAPGGGAAGGNAWTGSSYAGGKGGAGQVVLSYVVKPTCATPCIGWIIQNCSTCATGCYIDGGMVAPTTSLQTSSVSTTTTNYGYVFWAFNASADSTYYFDLCASTGTAGVSWLRLHNGRTSGNNYCMDTGSTQTKILENVSNGCTGTGSGLSKLIWTCQTSGTYYLETAVGVNMIPWGISSSQTAVLSYKTLPSYSFVCSDVFYDKGIDGTNGSSSSYNNDENWIYTYYPTDTIGSVISAQFVSFSTAPGDVLCVYDGNSINAPLIGCYGGPSITGSFTSTASNGSLTFQFISDDSLVSTGWQANISCIANVAVGNNASANKVRIFPNPAKDQLEISGLKWDATTKIKILDVVGKVVSIIQPIANSSQSKTILDVNTLTKGVYFVQIENQSGKWNGKFVKE